MRGFTKAAVSLSSILAPVSAFVIPESAPLSVGGSKPSVEYRELLPDCHDCSSTLTKVGSAEALVKFKTEQTQASNDEQPVGLNADNPTCFICSDLL